MKRRRSILILDKEKWLSKTEDIRNYRIEKSKEQDGLDPILMEPLVRGCLDHDHWEGRTRGVLSQHTNTWEGYVVKYWMKYVQSKSDRSLSFALRNLAEYLEQDFSNSPLHLSFVSDMRKFLERCTKPTIAAKAMSDLNIELNEEEMTQQEMVEAYLQTFVQKYECEEN